MVLYCKSCKNMIKSPRYKYLYINNKKTDIIICVECHITYYLLRILSLFGIIWDLKTVSSNVRESNKIKLK